MSYTVAGIDVHKKVLMVVLGDVSQPHWKLQRQRFGATIPELKRLAEWLAQCDTQEVVMESTAQYWKPVWMDRSTGLFGQRRKLELSST